MPTYGRTYVVADRSDGYGKTFSGPGSAGAVTLSPGTLAYYEILEKMAKGELDVQKWDDVTSTPYAYSTKTGLWVSYDDPKSLSYKVSYVIEKELAGAMVWAIDQDNFSNSFATLTQTQSSVPQTSIIYPLINTIKGILDDPSKRVVLPAVALPAVEPQDGSSVGDDNFGEPAVYDTGTAPSVGLNSGNTVVEVHKNANDDALYYHVGKVADNKIAFFRSYKYDTGVQSSVAIADDGWVVEVHKSQSHDTLWYNYGKVDGDKITFGTSQRYDTGTQPSVAIANDGLVVEVHKSEGDNTLLYHIGRVKGTNIDWGDSQRYGEGLSPSVAITNDGLVVAVHQAKDTDDFGKIRFHIGRVNGNKIDWGPTSEYDSGALPSVAINNDGLVVEVHQSEIRDTVWYRGVGQVKDNTINWRNEKSQQYSNGREPRVTCNGESVVEVHTDGEKLFCSVLTIPSIRSNWIELRGANSYLYCVCNSGGNDKQRRAASSHTMKVDAGAPYLYAVLTKDENSIDFPTGVVLTITAPDGTKYERNVQEENLLVIMSGASVRCLIVKDPQPGDWQMTMTAPEGVSFHCECNTVPSQDPYQTITNTLSPKFQMVKRSTDGGKDVTGWVGPAAAINTTAAAIGAAFGAEIGSVVPVVGTVIGGFLGATVGLAVGNVTSLTTTLFTQSPTPTTQIAATLTQIAQSNSDSETKKKKQKVFLFQVSGHAGFDPKNKLEFTLPGPNWQVRFFTKEPAILDYQLSIDIFEELARSDVGAVNKKVKETAYATITALTDYEIWDLEDPRYPSGTILVGDMAPTIDIAGTPVTTPIQFSTLLDLTQRQLDIKPEDKVVVYFNACRCEL